VDPGIEDAQRRVCETLGLDMSSLWQWPVSGDPPVLTHVYRPQGGPPVPQPMHADEYFPWVMRQMRAGLVSKASSLSELPEEAAHDREVSAAFGIKSFLTFPLSAGGDAPFGAVTFNTTAEEREWPDHVVRQLQLVAQVFANALARKRDEEALRVSEARQASAADLAGLAFYELDYGAGSSYVDDRFRDLFSLPANRASGLQPFEYWREHLHPDDLERNMDARRLSPQNLASVGIGKDFMVSRGYVKNDFDVQKWAAPEFLETAARELLEEEWKKRTTSKLPEAAAPLASGARLG
jgi:PAS domain-containing protein